MGVVEIFLIGVGLSMDAFAVAVCKGLSMTKINIKQTMIIATFFGGFQALMPFLGWALGSTFAEKIKKIDHWIAFVLLLYIGINMIVEAVKERNEKNKFTQDSPIDYKELTMMAVATSIDALAIGVTFSFLSVNIGEACLIIGLTTFVLSVIAVFIGNLFGMKFRTWAQIAGGIILIILGTRILVQHLSGIA